MSDRITLTGLRATGHHGVFEQERIDGQEFVVDVGKDAGDEAAGVVVKLASDP